MKKQAVFLGILAGLLMLVGSGCTSLPIAPKVDKTMLVEKVGVEPKANELLYRACEYLKQAKTFKFQADITRDVTLYDGLQVDFGGVSNITVERPNKLRAIYNGDERSRRSYFNGKQLTIYSLARNVYAQADVKGNIDAAIDYVYENFGFTVPLADLVYADPYAVLIENVDEGFFIGQHKVNGILCDHLAFQQELIDWQVWLEAGDTPFVRKVVITYKTEADNPEYEAELSHWEFNPSVSESDFEFEPPEGAEKIEFLPKPNVGTLEEEVN